ncbi:hypothetical protein N7509_011147 [Penicillium cosmopolitanum]|uniref:A-pheromone receptor PreA n=1 Tax=Penicillium cosmopolitanum TaxID=1131564 RepID=A0A9W9VSN3_9EURO|nr:uncharacterized protein N7509_011147 [Penicillium cosmopolitanum]KAJ5388606.1 hypothetical protein N7509_011147 [Penicillium cosmopolitanum]
MTTEFPRYPQAVLLPVLSFLSITVSITPLALHAKNRNISMMSLVSWYILLNIFNIINSLVWPNDDLESAWDGTGLCDIEVKFMVGGYFAVPGALVGIFRGLAIVLDTSRATMVPSRKQRWRNRIMDLVFCCLLPAVSMALHIVWQKDRYLLYAISGCVVDLDESWVSFALCFVWPPVICFIAAFYCFLVLIRLHRYRSDFGMILRSSQSNLNKSRFLRLLFLGLTLLICILPVELYTFYYSLKYSLPWHPYSWSRIHGPSWFTIVKIPTQGQVYVDRWSPIAAGFVIFGFFGFGRDATKIYRTILWCLGLGCCFPGVVRPLDTQNSDTPAGVSNSTTLIGTIRERSKLLFWKTKPVVCSDVSNSQQSQTNTLGSTLGSIDKSRYPSHRARNESQPRSWFRRWLPFNRRMVLNRRNDETLLDDLPVAGTTIYTNAWAGISQSRASDDITPSPSPQKKDFIHVKQVIHQQSELHI